MTKTAKWLRTENVFLPEEQNGWRADGLGLVSSPCRSANAIVSHGLNAQRFGDNRGLRIDLLSQPALAECCVNRHRL